MAAHVNRGRHVPLTNLTGIKLSIGTEDEMEKLSVCTVDSSTEVIDRRLGLPHVCGECSTCFSKNVKTCEGHFGVIKFPLTILNPHFLLEVAQILNKICPACKSVRKDKGFKEEFQSPKSTSMCCKYCTGTSTALYPKMQFKVSSSKCYERSAIVVEIRKNGRSLKNDCILQPADDFWDFIGKDDQEDQPHISHHSRLLTHAQVHHILKDVDKDFIRSFGLQLNSIFLNSYPVTPNCLRIQEVTNVSSNGQKLIFDERSRIYRKIVDFSGTAVELSSRVAECIKTSKLHPDRSVSVYVKGNDENNSGLGWIKQSVLTKRNNHCFRMVVVGDPRLKLSEVGICRQLAEQLQIGEPLTHWNSEKLVACSELYLLKKGDMQVRRKGNLVRISCVDELQLSDVIYRPINDGDKILINRPPSIHMHSVLALSVKIIPLASVVAINPLCCQPLYGDFDGDCLHGYIPQSIDSRVELDELLALDKQSEECLVSLSQDSLTAAYLILDHGAIFNTFQMQQLEMYCPQQLLLGPIAKYSSSNFCCGKEFVNLLFPEVFYDNTHPEVSCSERKIRSQDEVFQRLVKSCRTLDINFLHAFQEVLCEWLSMRGFSVSLSDLYIAADSRSRENMLEEVGYGLLEAEKLCNLELLMVKSNQEILTGNLSDVKPIIYDEERLSYEKQRSVVITQNLLESLKNIYRDIHGLCYRYATSDNSLLVMLKSGSKGTLSKLVQHSMCLGLQYSLSPLSFRMPPVLSCEHWNNMKNDETAECSRNYIPSATVSSSFLSGLNPLECFLHSASTRESSFSDNADIPGTLNRKLMFFLRDLYCAYDGTVRNSHGNHMVQFRYTMSTKSLNDKGFDLRGMGGHPVGSLAASAISEVAYNALDHPSSLLALPPLLSLKKTLDCGGKNSKAHQNMTLFLSEDLRRQRYGFEYGALEVKNHLERLLFADIVSSVRIMYTKRDLNTKNLSPWVCHFHVDRDLLNRRCLGVGSLLNTLRRRLELMKDMLVNIEIMDCIISSSQNEREKSHCIGISIFQDNTERSSAIWEIIQDSLVPSLLQTVIKGFREIQKVDILWMDEPKSRGELFLRVSISANSSKTRAWNLLLNNCIRIMDVIDWKRSHANNIHEFCLSFGIDAGWHLFGKVLESSVSYVGKKVLPAHIILVSDSFSVTGEFVALNSRGLKQVHSKSSPSPFLQACFASPGNSFVQAAKGEQRDPLQGSMEALVWGNIPTTGTGHFEIMYSGKGTKLSKPLDVYDFLGRQPMLAERHSGVKPMEIHDIRSESPVHMFDKCGGLDLEEIKKLQIKTSVLSRYISYNDILNLSRAIRNILWKYHIDQKLNRSDKSTLLTALYFHPRRHEKIGSGAQDIQVICRDGARCFCVVRTDGSIDDFSYHKCIHAALEIIHPQKASTYYNKHISKRVPK